MPKYIENVVTGPQRADSTLQSTKPFCLLTASKLRRNGRKDARVQRESAKLKAVSHSVSAETADATAASQELNKRLQDPDECSATTSALDGGVLELLLRELNEKGRLYRENGFISNAVEKPEDLRMSPEDSLHNDPTASLLLADETDLTGAAPIGQERAGVHHRSKEETAKRALTDGASSLDEEEAEEAFNMSGNILGEDNMFTGGESLQQKEKARKKATAKAHKKATASSKGTANDAVIADFVGQLRSYRALKHELSSWTSAFALKHKRTPQLIDIEQQGESLLIEKFRELTELRTVIFDASQGLRGKLEESAIVATGTLTHKDVMNANGSTSSKMSEGASRMAKALQYRQSRSQAAALSQPVQQLEAEQQSPQPEAEVSSASQKADFKPPSGVQTASARVKNAMLAAAKYKRVKDRAAMT